MLLFWLRRQLSVVVASGGTPATPFQSASTPPVTASPSIMPVRPSASPSIPPLPPTLSSLASTSALHQSSESSSSSAQQPPITPASRPKSPAAPVIPTLHANALSELGLDSAAGSHVLPTGHHSMLVHIDKSALPPPVGLPHSSSSSSSSASASAADHKTEYTAAAIAGGSNDPFVLGLTSASLSAAISTASTATSGSASAPTTPSPSPSATVTATASAKPSGDVLRADYLDLRESGWRQTFFWHNTQSDTACFVARNSEWKVVVAFRGRPLALLSAFCAALPCSAVL